jgi:hypothetical protein
MEPDMKDWWVDIGIWLIGVVVSIITIGIRNEMRTNQLAKSFYQDDGSFRFVKVDDCVACQKILYGKFDKIDNKLDIIVEKLTELRIKEANHG